MAAAVSALNALPAAAAQEEFMRCCGSTACAPAVRPLLPRRADPPRFAFRPRSFAATLAATRPFASPAAMHEAAARVWWNEACALCCAHHAASNP